MVKELNEKNRLIEAVAQEKKELEAQKTKPPNIRVETADHETELDTLSTKYFEALKEKIAVYSELVESA